MWYVVAFLGGMGVFALVFWVLVQTKWVEIVDEDNAFYKNYYQG